MLRTLLSRWPLFHQIQTGDETGAKAGLRRHNPGSTSLEKNTHEDPFPAPARQPRSRRYE